MLLLVSERDFRQCTATMMVLETKLRTSGQSHHGLLDVAPAAKLGIAFRDQIRWLGGVFEAI
jgi:hypothetical protein